MLYTLASRRPLLLEGGSHIGEKRLCPYRKSIRALRSSLARSRCRKDAAREAQVPQVDDARRALEGGDGIVLRENIKEHSDTRIVVSYPQEFKDITLHARSSYRRVFVSINSTGGKKGAKTRVVKYRRSHLPVILGGRD